MSHSAVSAGGTYVPSYGDVVWAKMQGYPYWPGEVQRAPKNTKVPSTKKQSFWIFFYGSENFGWAVQDHIVPFEQYKEKHMKGSKRKDFEKGVATAVQKCLERKAGGGTSSEEADQSSETASVDKIPLETPVASTSAEPSKKKTKKVCLPDAPIPVREKSILYNFYDGPNAIQTNEDFISSFNATRLPSSNNVTEIDVRVSELDPNSRKYTVGVIGIGKLGSEVTSLLLHSKHDVTIWNRTETKARKFESLGAKIGESPGQVFKSCDITLVCVSSGEAVQAIAYMRSGLLTTADSARTLVVLTLVDPDETVDLAEKFVSKGARYLEAPVIRTVGKSVPDQAELDRRSLVVLSSGDKDIFDACSSVFAAISRCSVLIGPALGVASKLALITNNFIGSSVSAIAEAVALCERTEMFPSELLHVLSVSPIGSTYLLHKGKAMMDKEFPSQMPLEETEEAMRSALNLSARYSHSMPLSAAAHQLYVSAKGMSYADRDMSAVYYPARF